MIPEYRAGVFQKKGARVDYAIIKNGEPVILIECKSAETPLSNTIATQLFKYFISTEARIGILTNGLQYRFYTDLDKPNKMDTTPFMQIDLLHDPIEKITEYLQLFTHSDFDIDLIIHFAQKIKYTTAIKRLLSEQLDQPSEKFVSFILGKVYKGVKTKSVKESFTPIIHDAFREFIDDSARDRLEPESSTVSGVRDIPITSDWMSLAECSPNSKDLPLTVQLWTGDEITVKYWTHLPRAIVSLLYKENNLNHSHLPYTIGKGKSFIINRQPVHRDGTEFAHNRSPLKGSDLYMLVIADPTTVKKFCVQLFKDFDKNPETDLLIQSNHDLNEDT